MNYSNFHFHLVFFLWGWFSGQELVVFRGESGQAFVVDAYCPHLGANLGVGGQIRGNCIECPFHGWTFRGEDGKCVKIPYSEKGEVSISTL